MKQERKIAGESAQRLKVGHEYNQKMGGVDKNVGMVDNYSSICKCHKWTTKMFFHFFEEAIFNSFIIYNNGGDTKIFLAFKVDVIYGMLRAAGACDAVPSTTYE